MRALPLALPPQEAKLEAIKSFGPRALTALVGSMDTEVRQLSCDGLAAMAKLPQGREAIGDVAGIQVLCVALMASPQQAAHALRVVASARDGAAQLLQLSDTVVPALVSTIGVPAGQVSATALTHATAALAGLTTTDAGIEAALKYNVPACVVAASNRALSGDLKDGDRAATCELLDACASCLMQLCHHSAGKTAVRQAEGIPVLTAMVSLGSSSSSSGTYVRPPSAAPQSGSLLLARKASAALMAIAIEAESKLAVMQAACGVLVKLLLAPGGDRDVAVNARGALCNSAEDLHARRLLEGAMSADDMKRLLAPLPYPPPDYRYKVVLPPRVK